MICAARHALLAAYDYLVVYLGVTWLGILCLAWTPFALLVLPLLGDRRGRALGRYVVMNAFRFYPRHVSRSRAAFRSTSRSSMPCATNHH